MSGGVCHIVFSACGEWEKGRRSVLHDGTSIAKPANAVIDGCLQKLHVDVRRKG
jgi:hypothetical protein